MSSVSFAPLSWWFVGFHLLDPGLDHQRLQEDSEDVKSLSTSWILYTQRVGLSFSSVLRNKPSPCKPGDVISPECPGCRAAAALLWVPLTMSEHPCLQTFTDTTAIVGRLSEDQEYRGSRGSGSPDHLGQSRSRRWMLRLWAAAGTLCWCWTVVCNGWVLVGLVCLVACFATIVFLAPGFSVSLLLHKLFIPLVFGLLLHLLLCMKFKACF